MNIVTVERTENPEELACRAARGDYFDGFYPDVSYDELMDGVEYTDTDMEMVKDLTQMGEVTPEAYLERNAKTYALLRKTLKRGHFGEK
jgi:hypothetical protein